MAVTQVLHQIDDAKILKQVIPTVFNKRIDTLDEILKAETLDEVIDVEQAGGHQAITVERIAIHIDDARIQDKT